MTTPPQTGTQIINLREIVPSRWQARTAFDPAALLELATSIQDHGLINPLIVFTNEHDQVELLAGERRSRAIYAIQLVNHKLAKNLEAAARLAAGRSLVELAAMFPNVVTIPTPARFVGGTLADLQEIALVDNLQRADLGALDEARALKQMLDAGYSQRKLAERLGKSQTYISQRLVLLDLAPALVEQLVAGQLDPTAARDIARLHPDVQPEALAYARQQKFSSRQVNTLATRMIELADPAAWKREGQYARFNHLVGHTLEQQDLPVRQRVILALAADNSDQQPKIPKEEWNYRRLFKRLGLSNDEYADGDRTWLHHAPGLGVSCQNCQFLPFVARVAELNAKGGGRNFGAWPRCAPDVNACPAHLPVGSPVRFDVPFNQDLTLPPDVAAHIVQTGDKNNWERTVDDIEAGLQLAELVNARAQARAAEEQAAREFGAENAIAGLLQDQPALTPNQLLSQPCAACAFFQAGGCRYQTAKPQLGYNGEIAALWRSDDGHIIARCNLFRFADLVAWLPAIITPPASLVAPLPVLMDLFKRLRSTPAFYGGVSAPAWLNVPRAGTDTEPPAWGQAEKHLQDLLKRLAPGQRVALLAIWPDHGFSHSSRSTTDPVFTLDPANGRQQRWTPVRRYTTREIIRVDPNFLKPLVEVFVAQETASS